MVACFRPSKGASIPYPGSRAVATHRAVFRSIAGYPPALASILSSARSVSSRLNQAIILVGRVTG